MINIFINDEIEQVEFETCLYNVLEAYGSEKGITLATIAVAVNGSVVPRATWQQTQCQANDKLELFSVVAGG
ncbi:sulfur carrier protein ThiS [Shewanella sp. 1CM18E]|uniref:sulfur carrier protein ThiS n=1 Tax=Shewanella sp. 1CM18E TaxID=2929169 RepID=UPI0020C0F98E|nr:sulfur carrier protein ThiS [Shewanella sp. 1CM18E]MCK8047102.1 sulfur carrier protein ThiS [Shewanella sp. 1CM18E]